MRASRPTDARVVLRPSGLAGHFGRFVGAGFIPPGALRRRRVRGTMQASSPTWVCGATRLRFPGWSCTLPLTVGADSISARKRLRRRGVRRDEGIPPYDRPGGCSPFRFGGAFRKVCRGGIYPSRGPSGAAGFPGRCKHRPLQRFVITQGPRFQHSPAGVCPAKSACRAARSWAARVGQRVFANRES